MLQLHNKTLSTKWSLVRVRTCNIILCCNQILVYTWWLSLIMMIISPSQVKSITTLREKCKRYRKEKKVMLRQNSEYKAEEKSQHCNMDSGVECFESVISRSRSDSSSSHSSNYQWKYMRSSKDTTYSKTERRGASEKIRNLRRFRAIFIK